MSNLPISLKVSNNLRFVTPSFRWALSPKHFQKTVEKTFKKPLDEVGSPVTIEQFLAPQVKTSYGNTFDLKNYWPNGVRPDNVTDLEKTPVGFPDRTSSSGVRWRLAKVEGFYGSLAYQSVCESIKSGFTPQILDHIYVECDFTVSIQTALELGATAIQWPDIHGFETGGVVDFKGDLYLQTNNNKIAFTNVLYFTDQQAVEDTKDFLEICQAGIFSILEKKHHTELPLSLLPLCSIIQTTVSKPISNWRNFIMSESQSLESFYIKKTMFEQAMRVTPALFTDCNAVVESYETYIESLFK